MSTPIPSNHSTNKIKIILSFFFLQIIFTSLFAQENKQGQFIFFKPSLLTYFKTSEIIESSGNEDNFWTTFNFNFDSQQNFSKWQLLSKIDFYILPFLNNKGRNYQNFSPPNFLLNQLFLELRSNQKSFFQYSLKVGLFNAYSAIKPFISTYLPIAYTPPTSSNLFSTYPLIFGNRDEDIVSGNYLPRFDIGLVNDFIFNFYSDKKNNQQIMQLMQQMILGIGIINGEEGLDSNSAKTIIAKWQFEIFGKSSGDNQNNLKNNSQSNLENNGKEESNQKNHEKNNQKLNQKSLAFFSIHARVGNVGSIPVKEKKHLYKISFYHNKNKKGLITFGLESSLLLHGVFNKGQFSNGSLEEITGRDHLTNENNLNSHFFYRSGFWSPSVVYNDGSYDDSLQINETTLYGGQLFLYFSINNLFSFLDIESHFSYYDPNFLAENKDMYRWKIKSFVRTTFKVVSSIKIIFATLYGYDPFYHNNSQFYERELREKHVNKSAVILDLDFYLGLLYRWQSF